MFNCCAEGVQFAATAPFSLQRRNCSFGAAEVFSLGRHIHLEKLKSGNLIYKKGNTIVIFNESNESRLSECALSLKAYNIQ